MEDLSKQTGNSWKCEKNGFKDSQTFTLFQITCFLLNLREKFEDINVKEYYISNIKLFK